jgi:hypothetical protein
MAASFVWRMDIRMYSRRAERSSSGQMDLNGGARNFASSMLYTWRKLNRTRDPSSNHNIASHAPGEYWCLECAEPLLLPVAGYLGGPTDGGPQPDTEETGVIPHAATHRHLGAEGRYGGGAPFFFGGNSGVRRG